MLNPAYLGKAQA